MENNIDRFINKPKVNSPSWHGLIIESNLPELLLPLRKIARNLWWSWTPEAKDLFESIDPELWYETKQNPIVLLDSISFTRLEALKEDQDFLNKMRFVEQELDAYIEARTNLKSQKIAYFSMEYGLHDSLKIYSGGLGVLAGDYLKEASDSKSNMVAVGLLYRYGYFKQVLNSHGEQVAVYDQEYFSKIPVNRVHGDTTEQLTIQVQFPGREVSAKVWKVEVGSVSLYLLDTDCEENSEEDRSITYHLYGGDNENRLKQEMLLGLGGIKALEKVGFEADVYHCNEGHAAFITLERLVNTMKRQSCKYLVAKEIVKASTLFTTHTPVPAGHDAFHVDLFRHYMEFMTGKLGISWEEMLSLGKAQDHEDKFNMSYLAANLSQNINGVSLLHGDVSKDLLSDLYPGYFHEELSHIGYVTNGVHFQTWTAPEFKTLYKKHFGNTFIENHQNHDLWKKIYDVSDDELWKTKVGLKKKLMGYVKESFNEEWLKRNRKPAYVAEALKKIDPNALTIGFARRFATYKRAHLLFRDIDRLSKIVNNPECPVQFIFAGKAHPADEAGQGLIKHIVEISQRPEFVGKIIFLPNYAMEMAKTMLQGVDIWLNTPTRPLEASGTSGEKGVMNGTLHFSVLDGWWVEGYQRDAGWCLPLERSFENQNDQDDLDAEVIYSHFEKEIVPAYYNKDSNGVSSQWVGYMKNTIARVAPNFTMRRQLNDYYSRFYNPQTARHASITENNCAKAIALAEWKTKIAKHWDGVHLKNVSIDLGLDLRQKSDEKHSVGVEVYLNNLNCRDIGVELVTCCKNNKGEEQFIRAQRLEVGQMNDGCCSYNLEFGIDVPDSYQVAIRIFAINDYMPHQFDFGFVKWGEVK